LSVPRLIDDISVFPRIILVIVQFFFEHITVFYPFGVAVPICPHRISHNALFFAWKLAVRGVL
jgi:hypothetical protein